MMCGYERTHLRGLVEARTGRRRACDVRAGPSGEPSTRIHQINLGAVYHLSKRTALYTVAIGQQSSGAGRDVDAASGAARNLAQIPNLVNSDTDKQLAVMAGIRHNFQSERGVRA